jgi:sulfur carrier protein ThiS
MPVARPTVHFSLPTVLKAVIGCNRFQVRATNVVEALEAAFAEYPNLRHHLTLESGQLRPHVLYVLNGECLARADVKTTEVGEGDEILIHQAISGGGG